MKKEIIKPGVRYNDLTIIEEVEPQIREVNLNCPSLQVSRKLEYRKEKRYQKIRMVRCVCDCGNERTVSLNALRNGQIKRCRQCVAKLHQ